MRIVAFIISGIVCIAAFILAVWLFSKGLETSGTLKVFYFAAGVFSTFISAVFSHADKFID